MATLDELKSALRQNAGESPKQKLSYQQYTNGFSLLTQGGGKTAYKDFIFPQLFEQLESLFHSRLHISVLEIGPGPDTVLASLPVLLRRKIRKYVAYEPNEIFASTLEKQLHRGPTTETLLPGLDDEVQVYHTSMTLKINQDTSSSGETSETEEIDEKFDVVLFCHSMYGLKPKRQYIERAVKLLKEGGKVIVFHRDGALDFGNLVCQHRASFPTGQVSVPVEDKALDDFAAFIAGFYVSDGISSERTGATRRETCLSLGSHQTTAGSKFLTFGAPDVMVVFNQHADKFPELQRLVPSTSATRKLKSYEARLCGSGWTVRPNDIRQVQECVRWALRYKFPLTVIGGSHSGNCLYPNVVAIDMGAFTDVSLHDDNGDGKYGIGTLVVAGAGSTTKDVIEKTKAVGRTVPLGARPSVGAGMWLQGGFGHLSRKYGLASDAVLGAVMVDLLSGAVLTVGDVPDEYIPSECTGWTLNEHNQALMGELRWALTGTGTNFCIVTSVVFRTYDEKRFLLRNFSFKLPALMHDPLRMKRLLTRNPPSEFSMDVYLHGDQSEVQLSLTLTVIAATYAGVKLEAVTDTYRQWESELGPMSSSSVEDGITIFDKEWYMANPDPKMSKTSSFKRCVFLKSAGERSVLKIFDSALKSRPSTLCYLHLLQGGGAIADSLAHETVFGGRDWSFACIVTGVWPRDRDDTSDARAAVNWVYRVASDLLPFSRGVYGADLGPDPRDVALSVRTFRPHRDWLARLKRKLDPHDVLAFASPLPKDPKTPKLIILVTGKSWAGKDYVAEIVDRTLTSNGVTTRVAGISDVTKLEYADSTGADFFQLLKDRAYKEEHREGLTAFYQNQVQQRPSTPEDHFLQVVYYSLGVDVLLITGLRDEAPVAKFWHLSPHSRMLELRVNARDETRHIRMQNQGWRQEHAQEPGIQHIFGDSEKEFSAKGSRPDLVLSNDIDGGQDAAVQLTRHRLLPFFHNEFRLLSSFVHSGRMPSDAAIEFQHILGIAQEPRGLGVCVPLLREFIRLGDWGVDRLVCCESGGWIFASPLALQLNVPLALVRKKGKLPPPTVSVEGARSHISSSMTADKADTAGEGFEIGRDVIGKGESIVIVDDVLASGRTVCAVLELLEKVGVRLQNVNVLVVAEFPVHRGRECLRQRGYGGVGVQSLLVFGGA